MKEVCNFNWQLRRVTALACLAFAIVLIAKSSIAGDTKELEYEKIGRNGNNVFIYTPYTDSVSLWKIAMVFKKQGETMVSFFDAKINGSVDDYLMSDHWWAHYILSGNGQERLSFTGYGRRTWGEPPKEKRTVVKEPKPTPEESITFGRPIMSMWSGVKLYYGAGKVKQYVGKIICFRDDLVKVEYPSGNTEWKSRQAIIDLKGQWYVDKNDPALKEMKYLECF